MRGDRLRGRMGMGGVGGMGVRRQGLRRRETRVVRAMHFLQRLKAAFVNEPEVYRSFLFLMHAFRDQRVDIDGVVQEVTMLLAGHPALLQGFSCFLPDDYDMPLRSQKAPRSFYYHLQMNTHSNNATSSTTTSNNNNANANGNVTVNNALNELMSTISMPLTGLDAEDRTQVETGERGSAVVGDAAISMAEVETAACELVN